MSLSVPILPAEKYKVDQIELSQPQECMLRSVSNVIGWCRQVYKELVKDTKDHLSYRKWMKVVSRYYIDILNTDRSNLHEFDSIYKDLVYQTATKLSRNVEDVIIVFKAARAADYPLLNLKDLLNAVPLDISTALIKRGGMEEYISLLLRYHVLSLTEGLFLSMDPDLYNCLKKSSGLPILECYASPFNHNLEANCSLFNEDRVFGCYTRFDKFIDAVNYACRLCANPPFTPRAVAQCISKIINYMNTYNGEFVALLPVYHNYPPLEKILYYEHTQHTMLAPGTCTLHSFFTNTDIVTPMPLYLLVNVGGSKKASRRFLEELQERLKMKADSLCTTEA